MTESDAATPRPMRVSTVYRYSRAAANSDVEVDGFPNFYHVTAAPDGTRLLLEAGINSPKMVKATDGSRRPVIALRSSPWKAGGETTPWHDIFNLDHGHVRYFGDHKASSTGPVGTTRGNGPLIDAALLHHAKTPEDRAAAPPITIFRAVTENGVVKGYVEFCGVAVVERFEIVVQRDPKTALSFPNYVFDLAVLSTAAESELVDWRWIDDRRNPDIPLNATMRYAPAAWRAWVKGGAAALPRIRQRVLSSRVLSGLDQQPPKGSAEEKVLESVYKHFDDKKHAFEVLALKVAADVLGGNSTQFHEGWITQASGDGGTDFVGRLDVGIGRAMTSLVVLGQAKCVKPTTGISAEQLARVVARLRRGWIGVFVTTGWFTVQAQREMYDDQYPIVLIDSGILADTVRRMAMDSHGGDLELFLSETVKHYESLVSPRRPEEILST